MSNRRKSLQKPGTEALRPPTAKAWHPEQVTPEGAPKPPCSRNREKCQIQHADPRECDWYINCPEYQNDFWSWLKARSLPNGRMAPMPQNEIARLLGVSATKVHFVEKEAKLKLKESGRLDPLMRLLDGEGEFADESLNTMIGQIDERESNGGE